METSQYLSEVLNELQWVPQLISNAESEQLIHSIDAANKVFVAGAGRSGFMIRSLAMRLMHMEIQAYVVGETVTPGLGEGDLLIIGSGSGETKSLISMAEKAKKLGASLALLTTSPSLPSANWPISSSSCPVHPRILPTRITRRFSLWAHCLSKPCCCTVMHWYSERWSCAS